MGEAQDCPPCVREAIIRETCAIVTSANARNVCESRANATTLRRETERERERKRENENEGFATCDKGDTRADAATGRYREENYAIEYRTFRISLLN